MNELIHEIRALIQSARQTVVHSVDLIQVLTNFEIGRRIVKHEQRGNERAEYGKALLKELSATLTKEFGRGFSRSNLEYMRKFYLTYQDRSMQIDQTPSAKFLPDEISQMPSGKSMTARKSQIASGTSAIPFNLSWSQYVFLISIDNPDERSFYEIEAACGGWTLPELKRQFNSGLYERLALSRDKDGVKKLAAEGQLVARPEEVVMMSNPFLFDRCLTDGSTFGLATVNAHIFHIIMTCALLDRCLTGDHRQVESGGRIGPRKTQKDTDGVSFFSEFRAFRGRKRGLA